MCHKQSGKGIAGSVEIAATFAKRLIGLMGRSSMTKEQGLYFPRCRSIHTFGMRISIDVLFLDKQMKITKMIKNLNPNRIAIAPFATRSTLELAAGVLHRHRLSVGDGIAMMVVKDENR